MPIPGVLNELIFALNWTTIAERAVAAVLISKPVDHVEFSIGNISINKTLMGMVQFAILFGNVEVKTGGSGENFEASYSSWRHRRKTPGKKAKIGEITIKQDAVANGTSKSVIFHECVHALIDICNYNMAPPDSKKSMGTKPLPTLRKPCL